MEALFLFLGGFIVYDRPVESPINSDFIFALCVTTLFFNVAILAGAGLCNLKSDSLVDLFIILIFLVIGVRDLFFGVAVAPRERVRPRGGVVTGLGTF